MTLQWLWLIEGLQNQFVALPSGLADWRIPQFGGRKRAKKKRSVPVLFAIQRQWAPDNDIVNMNKWMDCVLLRTKLCWNRKLAHSKGKTFLESIPLVAEWGIYSNQQPKPLGHASRPLMILIGGMGNGVGNGVIFLDSEKRPLTP